MSIRIRKANGSRAWKAAALAAGVTLLAGACSSSPTQSSSSKGSGTLTIAFGNNTPFADDFNPFSPTAQLPAQRLIYEPQWFFEIADYSQTHPMHESRFPYTFGGTK